MWKTVVRIFTKSCHQRRNHAKSPRHTKSHLTGIVKGHGVDRGVDREAQGNHHPKDTDRDRTRVLVRGRDHVPDHAQSRHIIGERPMNGDLTEAEEASEGEAGEDTIKDLARDQGPDRLNIVHAGDPTPEHLPRADDHAPGRLLHADVHALGRLHRTDDRALERLPHADDRAPEPHRAKDRAPEHLLHMFPSTR